MFAVPILPYKYDALEPTISARTLHFHHDKHHVGYVNTVNKLLEFDGNDQKSLESIIVGADRADDDALFNAAAQAWNHSFFWASMAPRATRPTGDLATAIDEAFGGLDGLKAGLVAEGVGQFGSGWIWLVADGGGGLRLIATHDADSAVILADVTPLLVCDLWEHAYYLDHQNDRAAFLTAWFDNLANWPFAAKQFAAARDLGEAWRHPLPERVLQHNGVK